MNLAVGFNPRLQAKYFPRRVAAIEPTEKAENMANTYTALYSHVGFSRAGSIVADATW